MSTVGNPVTGMEAEQVAPVAMSTVGAPQVSPLPPQPSIIGGETPSVSMNKNNETTSISSLQTKKTAAELSIEEQQIIAEIQELQRQLRELKSEQQDEEGEAEDEEEVQRRILIVANRLPIRASRDGRTQRWVFEDAPGGLATALRGIAMDIEFIWVGWVGCDIPVSERPRVTQRLMRDHNCYPVYLETKLMEKYYNGFCNDVLWPLFHYVPLPMYQAGAEKKFDPSLWEAYKEANARFASAVCQVWDAGDDDTCINTKTTINADTTTTTSSKNPTTQKTVHNGLIKLADDEENNESNKKNQQEEKSSPVALRKVIDLVWVHDYHLMRLPLELRKTEPDMPVAWFLHTPFPSSEVYRILPFRKELLEGVLHADLVGFHTYDYARHFLSACSRVLDLGTTSPKGIEFGSRFCSIGVFPIGIDPNQISNALGSRAVDIRARELGSVFEGRKVIIGVDRLDYIKGMPHKLLAFELFLAKYPQWIGQVTLIQVGVPTRIEVEEYRSLAKHVNELVGRINGVYGNLEYAPVHYINQSIPQNELIAIYHIADACLVTSVRDGMNLVSHEYVAAQADLLLSSLTRRKSVDIDDDEEEDLNTTNHTRPRVKTLNKDGPGVLILSEFAGSAQSLSGAIRINPWNTEELAEAIHTSLTLSRVERELRWNKLYRYVTTNTASYWARSFVTEFKDVCDHPPLLSNLPRLQISQVLRAYENASHRLLVADYDGTLTQRQPLPELASPAPFVTQLLATLAKDDKNTLYVMSGRERKYMDKWLGKYRVGLAAEFGFCHRAPDDPPGEWTCLGKDLDISWKQVVQPIMQYFAERTPGTYIEFKESSLAWHFQDADPHFGAWQAKDMQIHLEDALANQPLQIIQGKRFVEVRHVGVNKSLVLEDVLRRGPKSIHGTARILPLENVADESKGEGIEKTQLLAGESNNTEGKLNDESEIEDFDFVLCVGDDRSDEDMYQLLKTHYRQRLEDKSIALYLVRIGTGATQAEYFLDSIIDLRKILRNMAGISLRDMHQRIPMTK
mmetsp:Transcript_19468/g.29583  ORF Transcript_19468/g.29583 Transcript_19468/m.29583 type:complete len:1022 (+) Transcript_19468:51-3116(+)|eukprot:CAMPEP_0197317894 /NCGR_PEP_ID=MMETSP0891-20130614/49005_1 /TAXON_ID=44058 ORGANISM="Aureoumbra lagunensis, Strain CCMP1510" /NCGR_SAMPLE_ID=MMETSP0891 /ASSEMBLY_ACC=CAM_ASM_000534 /LENGTH=1021 /DNA_ID=CAMNT_0042808097 /DNA_START=9 /DNA_END=3074 /DNA_ORIENTATION=+